MRLPDARMRRPRTRGRHRDDALRDASVRRDPAHADLTPRSTRRLGPRREGRHEEPRGLGLRPGPGCVPRTLAVEEARREAARLTDWVTRRASDPGPPRRAEAHPSREALRKAAALGMLMDVSRIMVHPSPGPSRLPGSGVVLRQDETQRVLIRLTTTGPGRAPTPRMAPGDASSTDSLALLENSSVSSSAPPHARLTLTPPLQHSTLPSSSFYLPVPAEKDPYFASATPALAESLPFTRTHTHTQPPPPLTLGSEPRPPSKPFLPRLPPFQPQEAPVWRRPPLPCRAASAAMASSTDAPTPSPRGQHEWSRVPGSLDAQNDQRLQRG